MDVPRTKENLIYTSKPSIVKVAGDIMRSGSDRNRME
jgi:hypothetical protein